VIAITETERNGSDMAFDETRCRELMEAVLVAVGSSPKVLAHKRAKDPHNLHRQVAKMVALERGFNPRTVAAMSDCYETTVGYAKLAIERRVADGKWVAETLEKGRKAAETWCNFVP
jgi:hypothetical protein